MLFLWQLFAEKPVENLTQLSALEAPSEKDIRVGSDAAQYKVVLFADYECPFCRDVDEKIHDWIGEFGTSTIAFYLRHFPLTNIHPRALEFAKDVECAKRLYGDDVAFELGKYLYDHMDLASEEILRAFSETNAVANERDIMSCTLQPEIAEFIGARAYEALLSHMRGTPSFAIYDTEIQAFVFSKTGGDVVMYDEIFRNFLREKNIW